MNFQTLQTRAAIAPVYREVRAAYPTTPAREVVAFIKRGDRETMAALCGRQDEGRRDDE